MCVHINTYTCGARETDFYCYPQCKCSVTKTSRAYTYGCGVCSLCEKAEKKARTASLAMTAGTKIRR